MERARERSCLLQKLSRIRANLLRRPAVQVRIGSPREDAWQEGSPSRRGGALVEQVELPFADHGDMAAPVEVGEDLDKGDGLGEGDGGLGASASGMDLAPSAS